MAIYEVKLRRMVKQIVEFTQETTIYVESPDYDLANQATRDVIAYDSNDVEGWEEVDGSRIDGDITPHHLHPIITDTRKVNRKTPANYDACQILAITA
jgi:hypothetical protein